MEETVFRSPSPPTTPLALDSKEDYRTTVSSTLADSTSGLGKHSDSVPLSYKISAPQTPVPVAPVPPASTSGPAQPQPQAHAQLQAISTATYDYVKHVGAGEGETIDSRPRHPAPVQARAQQRAGRTLEVYS